MYMIMINKGGGHSPPFLYVQTQVVFNRCFNLPLLDADVALRDGGAAVLKEVLNQGDVIVCTDPSRRGDPCGRPGPHHEWWGGRPQADRPTVNAVPRSYGHEKSERESRRDTPSRGVRGALIPRVGATLAVVPMG